MREEISSLLRPPGAIIEAVAERAVPLVDVLGLSALHRVTTFDEVMRAEGHVEQRVHEHRTAIGGERRNEYLLAALDFPSEVVAEITRERECAVISASEGA